MRTKKEMVLDNLNRGKVIHGFTNKGTPFVIGRNQTNGFYVRFEHKKKNSTNIISHISALMPFIYRNWYNLILK